MLLITTGTFSLAHLLATAAAVRLLPRGRGRLVALVTVIASAALVAVTGWPVLAPVGVGLLGLLWCERQGPARVPAV